MPCLFRKREGNFHILQSLNRIHIHFKHIVKENVWPSNWIVLTVGRLVTLVAANRVRRKRRKLLDKQAKREKKKKPTRMRKVKEGES